MKKLLLLISSIIVFSSSIASAEIVTINFRGTVSTTSGSVPFANIGSIVEGSYSYDDAVPNTSTDPTNYAEYNLPSPVPDNLGFTSLSINGAILVRAPNISIANVFIANDIQDWNNPTLTMDDIGMDTCCDIGNINGYLINHAYLQFNDNINNPLISNNLTEIAGSLNNFATKKIVIGTVDEFGSWASIEVDLDPVSINAPLEPLPPPNIVNIYFKGMITSVSGNSNIASVGSIIEGTYSYDESTRNTSQDPANYAEYKAPDPVPDDLGFTQLSINGASLVRSPVINNAIVHITNDMPDWSGSTGTVDDVGMDMCCEIGAINGTTISHAFLQFNDNINNPLQTDNLTEVAGALNRFTTRKIFIGTQDSLGNWIQIEALLEPVSTTAPPENDNVVAFRSYIREINDPTGQLTGTVNLGDIITGSWRYSPTLSDADPDPERADYAPVVSTGPNANSNNYLAFSVNNSSFKGDTDSDFSIMIENGSIDSPTGLTGDKYEVNAFSYQGKLSNGSYIDSYSVYFGDVSGKATNSTDLNDVTPSSFDGWAWADIRIGGRHPDGSFFSFLATIVALTRGSETVEDSSAQLFPASGTVYGPNPFDVSLLLKGYSAVPNVNASIANKNGRYTPVNCSITDTTNNQVIAQCPNLSNYFVPGDNLLRLQMYDNGVITVKTATYHWIP